MNTNVNSNVMILNHFVDFYMLEAMRAGISMAKSANPDNLFRRAFEKLELDVNEAFDFLSQTMAHRIYVYMWGAALGEAEYANEYCENSLQELSDFSYTDTFDFFPTEENVEMVKDVFGQRWQSRGYGGRAWKQIVEGLELYGKISDAAFIDHCVDLEHNGGCVFDKTGERPFNLNCHDWKFDGTDLHKFLDHKFSGDILNEVQRNKSGYNVSRKVYTLLTRYSNVVKTIEAPSFCEPSLEWLSTYTVEWNDGAFENTFTWEESNGGMQCEHCGSKITEDDAFYVNDSNLCGDCVTTCENCDETVAEDDTQWIDGEHQTWCDNCAQEHKVTCAECNLDFHNDKMSCSEDGYDICETCVDKCKCETCGELHYNLDEHQIDEHNESEEGSSSSEPYTVHEATFKGANETNITMKVYDFGSLFVFNLDTYYLLSHSKKHDNAKFAIMTPCGLWFKHQQGTFESAMVTAQRAMDAFDWAQVQTIDDWRRQPESVIHTIQALTTMEVK